MQEAAVHGRPVGELAQPGLTNGEVVGGIQQPVIAGVGDARARGDVPGGVGHDLHQAEGTPGTAGERVEPALGPDDRVNQMRIEPVAVRGLPCRERRASRRARTLCYRAPGGGIGPVEPLCQRRQVGDQIGRRLRGQAPQLGLGQVLLADRGQGKHPTRSGIPDHQPRQAPAGAHVGATVEVDDVVQHPLRQRAVELVGGIGRDSQERHEQARAMGTEVGTGRPEGRTGAFGAVEPGIVREAGELVGGASEIAAAPSGKTLLPKPVRCADWLRLRCPRAFAAPSGLRASASL